MKNLTALFELCLNILRLVGYSFVMICGLVLIGFGVVLLPTSADPETVNFFKRIATTVPFAELLPFLISVGFILVGYIIIFEAAKRMWGKK